MIPVGPKRSESPLACVKRARMHRVHMNCMLTSGTPRSDWSLSDQSPSQMYSSRFASTFHAELGVCFLLPPPGWNSCRTFVVGNTPRFSPKECSAWSTGKPASDAEGVSNFREFLVECFSNTNFPNETISRNFQSVLPAFRRSMDFRVSRNIARFRKKFRGVPFSVNTEGSTAAQAVELRSRGAQLNANPMEEA